MLEKLLKELGEKGYEVSWRYNVTLDCIDIRLERRFNKQWYKLNRMVTFAEMRDISGGQPGFEFAMTQILRWMVNKMEEDMGKHYGYRPQVVICDELAGKKGENDE